jgi:N-acetylglucosamine-6-phosphate deacetylase
MSTRTKGGSGISWLNEGSGGFISGCAILTPLRRIEEGAIIFRDGRIADFGPSRDVPGVGEGSHYRFDGCIAVPGFIDIHFHGALGVNFNEGSTEGTARALNAHLKNGTTACLPTLMTAPAPVITRAIAACLEAVDPASLFPEILGVNLEGPYISEEKRGVHDRDAIRPMTIDEIKRHIDTSKGMIRIVTVAPEREGALSFIEFLEARGIIASAGHTNANYDEMLKAIPSGVRLATHLFNAMKGIQQREPGAAGALLLCDDVYAEIIADGEHVHPALLKLVARAKGPGRIIAVSDASPEYGFRTTATRTKSGTLVGGTLPLAGALKNLCIHSGLALPDALRAMTLNPARLLGLERRIGSIRRGADADIVILDADLAVKQVFSKGKPILSL